MPVALQSINACVGISSLFTVNEQVITECLPCNDLSNTSTDNREIRKHFKTFKKNFLCQPKRHPAWVDLIFSRFLRTFLCSSFLNLRSRHHKCLSLLSRRTFC